jgi:hypothetical protein
MIRRLHVLLSLGLFAALAGCVTAPEPAPAPVERTEENLEEMITVTGSRLERAEPSADAPLIIENETVDEAFGFLATPRMREISVADAAELDGLTGPDLADFLELDRDGMSLIPVFAFLHEGRKVEIVQGFRGIGSFEPGTTGFEGFRPFQPIHAAPGQGRVYRHHHGFVFIDDRLAFVLDGERAPNADRIALEAWTQGAAPFADGFGALMAALEAARLDGPILFARYVRTPGRPGEPIEVADAEHPEVSHDLPLPFLPRTIRWAMREACQPDEQSSGRPVCRLRQQPLPIEELTNSAVFRGDFSAIRVGAPLPDWPAHYERLPERYEIVQRFEVSPGYELVGVKITEGWTCSPYGGGCGYDGERRFWLGARGGVVVWMDLDLSRLSWRQNGAQPVTDRACAWLRESDHRAPRYCRRGFFR